MRRRPRWSDTRRFAPAGRLGRVALLAWVVAGGVAAVSVATGAHRRAASVATIAASSSLAESAAGFPTPSANRGARPDAFASVAAGGGRPIPRSFLGLSIETWDLPLIAEHEPAFVRLLAQLKVAGDGPLLLRIGGDSADHTLWRAQSHHDKQRMFQLTSRWFASLRAITAAAHLKLLLDLNLAARSPAMAAAFTRTAVSELPAGSIDAIEVGNEPDLYRREPLYRLAALADIRTASTYFWDRYSAVDYAAAFRSYARAVSAAAGAGIALAGPEIANPVRDLGYLTRLIDADHAEIGLLSAHRYPYTACVRHSSRYWPTISRLLSPAASTGLAASVKPAVRLAAAAGLPFRLTEMDSVTCGGVRGVTDTFATALWAPDALFSLLADGVGGANIHVRQGTFNEAFAVTRRGLIARPLLYGLLAFARTLARGRSLARTTVHAPARDNLAVWAVRTDDGHLHVIALDKGRRSVRLALELPAQGVATLERLTAPGVRAEHAVRLAGQTLDASARWVGHLATESVAPGPDGYVLTLTAGSAALLNVKAGGRFPVVAGGPPPGQTPF